MIEKNIRKGSYRSQSDTIAKLQPQATDIEKAILGGLMIDRKSFDLIEGIISTQSFYEPRHQEIFTAIRNLYSNGNPIDTLTVTEELSKFDKCRFERRYVSDNVYHDVFTLYY